MIENDSELANFLVERPVYSSVLNKLRMAGWELWTASDLKTFRQKNARVGPRKYNKVFGVKIGSEYRYPNFQFDYIGEVFVGIHEILE